MTDADQVAELVRTSLADGYEETVAHGMATWQVPLATYPDTYNGEPLAYVSLAARKTGIALYLVGVYVDPAVEERLRDGFAAAGKKLDLGKSCLRFKRYDDLDVPTLAAVLGAHTPAEFVAAHEASRAAG